MKKLFLLVSLLTTFSVNHSSAQDETSAIAEPKHRYFSFGFETGVLTKVDFFLNDLRPATKIVFNFNPHKYVRLDLQFGSSKYINEYNYMNPSGGITTYELTDQCREFAIGLFGVLPFKDGFQMYGGFRFGKAMLENEFMNFSSSGGQYVDSEKSDIKIFSPLVGGEYKFGNRFSIAGEIKFSFIDESLPSSGNTTEFNELNLTETALVFRFYPF